jgi:hypothetical protein
MTGKHPRPSDSLPAWARAYFDRWRAHFDEMEMVPTAPDGTKLWLAYHFPGDLEPGETLTPTHRHDAFYRLFCADNDGLRRMWRRADKVIVIDMAARPLPEDGRWFLGGALIYGTDTVIPDEKPLRRPSVPKSSPQRLNPEQRAARKAAHLLQCLFHVTPPDCYAGSKNRWFGATVEWLVIRYGFELGPFDYNRLDRVYDLTYTTDSKRGWKQHRRAHDRIRHQVIAAIHRLLKMTCDPGNPLIAECRQIADDLATWPDMETEHGHQIELRSQKAGWADWFRYAYDRWLDALEWGEARGHLRECDWATLAATLFPEHFDAGPPDERLIRAVISEIETSRPERKRAYREKVLAEEATLQASRARRD